MKRIFLFISVISIIFLAANISQSFPYWSKTYGGGNYDILLFIQLTNDGGYIAAGSTQSFGSSGYDIWVLKLDNSGNVQWQKTYGGTLDDQARSVLQTKDNGYILGGWTQSFEAGSADTLLLKLGSSGNVQWQKTYGGIFLRGPYAIQQTRDNGYIVAGDTRFSGAGSYDFCLLKLDSSGNIQWQKTYGGVDDDLFYSVQQTNDSGYILAGSTQSFGSGGNDIWVLKLDNSGNVQWQKIYGGTFDDSNPWSVQQTIDSGYILAGSTLSYGSGAVDILLIKLGNSGNVQWQRTYGSNSFDVAYSFQQTNDNGYIVAGRTEGFGTRNSDGWILKLDSSGNISGCDAVGISDSLATETTVMGGIVVLLQITHLSQ